MKTNNTVPSRKGERDTLENINKIAKYAGKIIWWIIYIITITIIVCIACKDPKDVYASRNLHSKPICTHTINTSNILPSGGILLGTSFNSQHYTCSIDSDTLPIDSTEANTEEKVEEVESTSEVAKKEQPKQTQPVNKPSKAELQNYAHDLVINTYNWSEYDFECLVNLWNKESGWNPNAHNKSSGAHGIPQSLPASKMASEGDDYYTNGYTQIRWGLKYISNRYGSPSNAWNHFLNKNWY